MQLFFLLLMSIRGPPTSRYSDSDESPGGVCAVLQTQLLDQSHGVMKAWLEVGCFTGGFRFEEAVR